MASAFPSFTQSVQGPPGPSQTIAALVPARSKRGLLGRFLDALIESRRREAEQHIARLLAHAITRRTQSTGYGTFRDREVHRRIGCLKRKALGGRRMLGVTAALALGAGLFWATCTATLVKAEVTRPGAPKAACVEAERKLAPWFQAEMDRKAQVGLDLRDDFNLMLTWFRSAQGQCASGMTDRAAQNFQAIANMIGERTEQRQPEPEDG